MKYYKLESVIINGNFKEIDKNFHNRTSAIDYIFKSSSCGGFFNDLQLLKEYQKEKHVIEYVCNHNTRFTVSRCFK